MQYDSKGRLTRDGAIAVIQSGGTVLLNNHIYGNIASLPGEADFAKGDEQSEAVARARLTAQIANANRQLASLDAVTATASADPKAPGTITSVYPPKDDDLGVKTSEELKALAKDKKIPHYWTMSDAKLIEALRA